jgi:hypothetical protein
MQPKNRMKGVLIGMNCTFTLNDRPPNLSRQKEKEAPGKLISGAQNLR